MNEKKVRISAEDFRFLRYVFGRDVVETHEEPGQHRRSGYLTFWLSEKFCWRPHHPPKIVLKYRKNDTFADVVFLHIRENVTLAGDEITTIMAYPDRGVIVREICEGIHATREAGTPLSRIFFTSAANYSEADGDDFGEIKIIPKSNPSFTIRGSDGNNSGKNEVQKNHTLWFFNTKKPVEFFVEKVMEGDAVERSNVSPVHGLHFASPYTQKGEIL